MHDPPAFPYIYGTQLVSFRGNKRCDRENLERYLSFKPFLLSPSIFEGIVNERERDSKTMASPLVFVFGVLGNIASFVCFLAPLPTFYRVCKKKSTEGFQSIPYVAALFSAMLWIFYAYFKTDVMLLITINSFGCVIETIYLAIYLGYSPKKARMLTVRLILLCNFGGFCAIVLVTHFLAKSKADRLKLLGWICVVFSTSVFAAPLSIIRTVIRTKSVEFMPFPLSLLLTISAVMWLLYGVFLRDIYVTLPNIVGLTFGMIQMVLYAVYRNSTPVQDQKLSENKGDIENGVAETVTDDIEIAEKKQDQQPEKKENKQEQEERTEQNNNETEKRGEGDPQGQMGSCHV